MLPKIIYKYQLELTDFPEVMMPDTALILSVQSQNGTPTIWAFVNPEDKLIKRKFMIVGTGHPFEPPTVNYAYLATLQIRALVWHIFELR